MLQMRIIFRKAIIDFYKRYPDSKSSLESWFHEVKQARWKTPADIKTHYSSASIVKNSRVIFNICGNKYRLLVKVEYSLGVIFIRFVGTHNDYDKIDVEVY